MSDILVRKSNIETRVTEKKLYKYLENGWVVVEEKPIKKVNSTLSQYTKKQLLDIAKQNNVNVKEQMKKKEIIEKIEYNKSPLKINNNKGFTDNLIKE